MQLRRFTADSTPAALGAVRLALGDDAIILANRRLGDQVEIIATGHIEDAETMAQMSIGQLEDAPREQPLFDAVKPPEPSVPDAMYDKAPLTVKQEPTAVPPAESAISDDIVNISSLSAQIESEAKGTVPLRPLSVVPATFTQVEPNSQSSNGGIAGNEVADEPRSIDTRENGSYDAFNEKTTDFLAAAFEAQSLLINNHFKSLKVNLWGRNAPERSAHLQQLFALGIGAELAIRLVERAESGMSLEDSLRQSFALLKSTLPIGSDKTLSVPGVTIVSGAPGSGKTTALVKLATEHVKASGNQSIVIICADTRRIGAFEELQAYGRLLGVPTVHAHDTGELDSLLQAFTHKQLVLIDHTLPGASDSMDLPECLVKPRSVDSVRHLFVLPATTQSATADALIARHCNGRKIQCVLTHLDTSARLGELFNAIIRHHLPIAYWSDAASVQRPLQKADASVLVATAVAMSRRINQSADDQWLQRLIQPTDTVLSGQLLTSGYTAVNAS